MMTDRPNVTSSGAVGPPRRARPNRLSWSTSPSRNASGTMISMATHRGTPNAAMTVVAR
jgi:hypothetical protein